MSRSAFGSIEGRFLAALDLLSKMGTLQCGLVNYHWRRSRWT